MELLCIQFRVSKKDILSAPVHGTSTILANLRIKCGIQHEGRIHQAIDHEAYGPVSTSSDGGPA